MPGFVCRAQVWAPKCSSTVEKPLRSSLTSFRKLPPVSQEYWGPDTFGVAQHPDKKADHPNAQKESTFFFFNSMVIREESRSLGGEKS